jgi:hypothetical protein
MPSTARSAPSVRARLRSFALLFLFVLWLSGHALAQSTATLLVLAVAVHPQARRDGVGRPGRRLTRPRDAAGFGDVYSLQRPPTSVDLMNYNPERPGGWYVYGKGTVTRDGAVGGGFGARRAVHGAGERPDGALLLPGALLQPNLAALHLGRPSRLRGRRQPLRLHFGRGSGFWSVVTSIVYTEELKKLLKNTLFSAVVAHAIQNVLFAASGEAQRVGGSR